MNIEYPIWYFCPFSESKKECGGICSDQENHFRCEHLIEAEINKKHYDKGEPMTMWPHLCKINHPA